ncbi:TPA: prepilin peptidase-dependent protein [Klebsiella aerogenes]
MNRQHGYTLIEMLITMMLVVILSASGMYGWQRWQQQQRLWQVACQVRDYLVLLRDDANWHNRERVIRVGQSPAGWCLSASGVEADCHAKTPFTLQPLWPGITLRHLTAGIGFYGLRNSAWAGYILLQSDGGAWRIVVSNWGRIRLCREEEELCQ